MGRRLRKGPDKPLLNSRILQFTPEPRPVTCSATYIGITTVITCTCRESIGESNFVRNILEMSEIQDYSSNMKEYICPKCGGSDYFMSQRNIVKGMGWAQRGSIKSIPVCRVCDEIMQGAQIGFKNMEDYGPGRSSGASQAKSFSRRTKIFLSLLFLAVCGSLIPVTGVQIFSAGVTYVAVIGLVVSFFLDRRR